MWQVTIEDLDGIETNLEFATEVEAREVMDWFQARYDDDDLTIGMVELYPMSVGEAMEVLVYAFGTDEELEASNGR